MRTTCIMHSGLVERRRAPRLRPVGAAWAPVARCARARWRAGGRAEGRDGAVGGGGGVIAVVAVAVVVVEVVVSTAGAGPTDGS